MNTNQSGNWKNPFENHIPTPAKAEAKANESLKSRENEYLKDGLWYCKTCNHPTQMLVQGYSEPQPTLCLCKQKEKADREAAERKKQIEASRKRAFDSERSIRFKFTFANDDKRNAKASEALKKYCDNFDEYKKSGGGYILYSNQNGGGKTFLACAVANELIDKGKRVFVTDFLALRDRLVDPKAYTFVNKDAFIKSLLDYDLVVIDDLGVEQSTEFMLEVEYRVIDTLTDALVPLILTTNYTLAEIANADGKCEDRSKRRVLDRLVGSCVPLSVDQPNGKSRRLEKCAELTRQLPH